MPGSTTCFRTTADNEIVQETVMAGRQPPPVAPRATRVSLQSWQSATSGDENSYQDERYARSASMDSLESSGSSSSGGGGIANHRSADSNAGEYIPTRTVGKTPKLPSHNPLQFVKVQSPLYRKAEQQIKLTKEVKITREALKEGEEEWQSNLDNWKSRRRKVSEKVIQRAEEMRQIEAEEQLRQEQLSLQQRKIKKFSEIVEKRSSSRSYSLDLYIGQGDDSGLGGTPEPDEIIDSHNSTLRSDTSEGMTSEAESVDSDIHKSDKVSEKIPPKVPQKPQMWLKTDSVTDAFDSNQTFSPNKLYSHCISRKDVPTLDNISSAEPSDVEGHIGDIETNSSEDDGAYCGQTLNADSGLESLCNSSRRDVVDSASDLSQDSFNGLEKNNDKTNTHLSAKIEDTKKKFLEETVDENVAGHKYSFKICIKPGDNKGFGFTLKGGKDQGCSAYVDHITKGGPADVIGLKDGDKIISLSEELTAGYSHAALIFSIKQAVYAGILDIAVFRPIENVSSSIERKAKQSSRKVSSFAEKLALFSAGVNTSATNTENSKSNLTSTKLEEVKSESLVLRRKSAFENGKNDNCRAINRRSSCLSQATSNSFVENVTEKRLSMDLTSSPSLLQENGGINKKGQPPPVPVKPKLKSSIVNNDLPKTETKFNGFNDDVVCSSSLNVEQSLENLSGKMPLYPESTIAENTAENLVESLELKENNSETESVSLKNMWDDGNQVKTVCDFKKDETRCHISLNENISNNLQNDDINLSHDTHQSNIYAKTVGETCSPPENSYCDLDVCFTENETLLPNMESDVTYSENGEEISATPVASTPLSSEPFFSVSIRSDEALCEENSSNFGAVPIPTENEHISPICARYLQDDMINNDDALLNASVSETYSNSDVTSACQDLYSAAESSDVRNIDKFVIEDNNYKKSVDKSDDIDVIHIIEKSVPVECTENFDAEESNNPMTADNPSTVENVSNMQAIVSPLCLPLEKIDEDDVISASTTTSSETPDTETVIETLPSNLSPLPNDESNGEDSSKPLISQGELEQQLETAPICEITSNSTDASILSPCHKNQSETEGSEYLEVFEDDVVHQEFESNTNTHVYNTDIYSEHENYEYCRELDESLDQITSLNVIDEIEQRLMQQLEQQDDPFEDNIGLDVQFNQDINKDWLYFSEEAELLDDLTPRNLEPPREPPPPPPPPEAEISDQTMSIARTNSTRRIKKELWRRRSDFLGLDSPEGIDVDNIPPPPLGLEEILKQEREQNQWLEKRLSLAEPEVSPPLYSDDSIQMLPTDFSQNEYNSEYLLEDKGSTSGACVDDVCDQWKENFDGQNLFETPYEFQNDSAGDFPSPSSEETVKISESPQHKAKQNIQTLGAAPKAKIMDSNKWITEKVIPVNRKSIEPVFRQSSYNENYWLAQDGERKRSQHSVENLADRRYSMPSPYTNPHPDVTVRTWGDREYEFQQQRPRSAIWNEASNSGDCYESYSQSQKQDVQRTRSLDSQREIDHDTNILESEMHKCSCCGKGLCEGSAMGIEALRLYFHIECFRCCLCDMQLGNGSCGTDVQVKNNQLYCPSCFTVD